MHADRREVGHAPDGVGVGALAFEVVAVVLAPEQQGETVLHVLELLQLAVRGAPRERDAESEAAVFHQWLLDLDPVQRPVAPKRVLEARAQSRAQPRERPILGMQAEPQLVDPIIVDEQVVIIDAFVPGAPAVEIRQQVIAERRLEPFVLDGVTRAFKPLRGVGRVRLSGLEVERVGDHRGDGHAVTRNRRHARHRLGTAHQGVTGNRGTLGGRHHEAPEREARDHEERYGGNLEAMTRHRNSLMPVARRPRPAC